MLVRGDFRRERKGRTFSVRRSRWMAALPLIAALALILQTLFIPLHAASALGAKAAALAELSAAIGVDATLCAAAGDADPGAPRRTAAAIAAIPVRSASLPGRRRSSFPKRLRCPTRR